MTTGTKERADRERAAWVCDNCHSRTAGTRKRCADCGTSRY